MALEAPRSPAELRKSGRALWRAVVRDYALDEHELVILRESCRTADLCDDLQALLEAEGITSVSSQGERVHPAAVELRQQRVTLARLLVALRVPSGESTGTGRAQARGGLRGVYGIAGDA